MLFRSAGVFDPYEEDDAEAPVMDEFGNLIDPDEVPTEEEEDADEEELKAEESPFGDDAETELDADPADEAEPQDTEDKGSEEA